jgi:hypothetical protein
MSHSPLVNTEGRAPRQDGYLRLTPASRGVSRQSIPSGNNDALLFVDVEGDDINADELIGNLQQTPERLTHTRYVLIRWPAITATTSPDQEVALDARAAEWTQRLAELNFASQFKTLHWGVVRFRVGDTPVVTWAEPAAERNASDSELLARALRVELRTLLEFGHAIWRPTSYHYRLPSGQHAAAFIRVGDAFRSPRDVRVITSWLTPRMRDKQAIAADSATLVPLITDVHAVLATRGWRPGRVEMLDEYPRTKLDISRVIVPLRADSGGVLALMSVNSSGGYRGLFLDGLESAFGTNKADWSMVVMVDKTIDRGDEAFHTADTIPDDRVSTWCAFSEDATSGINEASCRWCKNPDMAQVVRIDPRTFEALVLPEVDRQMPSFAAARAATDFWNLCNEQGAVGHTAYPVSSPSAVSRPKGERMGVLIDNVALLASTTLATRVAERVARIHDKFARDGNTRRIDYTGYDAVLVSAFEAATPNFDARLAELLPVFGLQDATIIKADLGGGDFPLDAIQPLNKVVIFALGSVSGWNLRQLLLGVQDAWRPAASKDMAGIVLHARPTTYREWENLQSSFSGKLDGIWTTFLPWRNPMEEEHDALALLDHEFVDAQPGPVQDFILHRRQLTKSTITEWRERMDQFLNPDDPDVDPIPDPRAVLWGIGYGGHTKVRNESLYGTEADALTAYSAIGAALHATRQERHDYDPRWLVFDMPAISRSYFDAIILASILRWTEPQEVWWGNSDREARAVMSELIARTVEDQDRHILIPELLYAASQGKVPAGACGVLKSLAETEIETWDEADRAPALLGLALMQANRIPPRAEKVKDVHH